MLKFVFILFAFDFLNALVGNILLSLRISGVINGQVDQAVSIAFEIALLTAPAITLSFIGIYRLQGSCSKYNHKLKTVVQHRVILLVLHSMLVLVSEQ